MTTSALTCQELVELMTDYLEGALPAEVRERFDQHLTTCPGCVNYLEQIKDTIRLCGTLNEDTIPSQARDGLLHAFRNWKQHP